MSVGLWVQKWKYGSLLSCAFKTVWKREYLQMRIDTEEIDSHIVNPRLI